MFELPLNKGLPSRTPTLSVLWRSLGSLERRDEIYSGENIRLPVFAFRSGRLVPVGQQPIPATTEMVTVMGMVSKGHPDEELIKNCIEEMFAAHFAIQTKYQGKRADLKGSLNAKDALKELNRQKTIEQTESRKRYFSNLPELARDSIHQAAVIADYQRHGIQMAWFSAKNEKLFEFPPDEDDLFSLKKHAQEAREILEDRVHELFREFALRNLSRHFEPDSVNIRWVYRKYPLQIPPLEILGVERDKGDYRERNDFIESQSRNYRGF